MTGIPKFGKSWLDNFIPDEEMQNTFLTSEVVRNVIMIQCVYLASIYADVLALHRQGGSLKGAGSASILSSRFNLSPPGGKTIAPNESNFPETQRSRVTIQENGGEDKNGVKVGIIGCGQVGTMILTKLIEV
jgi:hypothetical protein